MLADKRKKEEEEDGKASKNASMEPFRLHPRRLVPMRLVLLRAVSRIWIHSLMDWMLILVLLPHRVVVQDALTAALDGKLRVVVPPEHSPAMPRLVGALLGPTTNLPVTKRRLRLWLS